MSSMLLEARGPWEQSPELLRMTSSTQTSFLQAAFLGWWKLVGSCTAYSLSGSLTS